MAAFRRFFAVFLALVFGFSLGVLASPAFGDRIAQAVRDDLGRALAEGVRDGLAQGIAQWGEASGRNGLAASVLGALPEGKGGEGAAPRTEEQVSRPEGEAKEVLSPVPAEAASLFTALERSMTPKEREDFLRWAQAKLTPDVLDALVGLWADRSAFVRTVELTSRIRGSFTGEDVLYLFDLLGRLEARDLEKSTPGSPQGTAPSPAKKSAPSSPGFAPSAR
ncbi:hypothetical protein [Brockia lithotrophica]|uniref:DUF2059 domain-containing protein n=1 Tax=Brockia lithotrophica TaxID=933949 RepID=A0A660KXH4_9BACL|nr:hypothetical protein [Brockia lithotrophica]RKQ84679.1 hypothetical protein C7438_1168 [Brockia lithotrophica]